MRCVCLLFILFFTTISFSQDGDTNQLLAQAENIVYSDPQEAIRIAEYILEKSDQDLEQFQASYLLTCAFYMQGKYDQALRIGLKASENRLVDNQNTKIKLNILLSKILTELDLNVLFNYYSSRAISLLNSSSKSTINTWAKAKVIQYGLNEGQNDSSAINLEELYKIKKIFKNIPSEINTAQIGNINLDLASLYIKKSQLDSAAVYLESAFIESRKNKTASYLEMKSLIAYSNFLFQKNAHSEAVDTLKTAMNIAQIFQNKPEQLSILQATAENYLALNNLKEFNVYNQKADALKIIIDDAENDAVNVAYNIFNDNETQRIELHEANSQRDLVILSIILFLSLLFLGFTKFRYRAKISQYQKFIGYLEKRKEVVETASQEKVDNVRTLNVPKEAEDILLKKLDIFERSVDFTNKDISLSRLALKFETNTKYLSEVVNTHKQKNFNAYINELRINYIIDKLNNEPQYLQYKISYLADESGFSSHSVFATVFKSVTGISPTAFIKILNKEQESQVA